MVLFLLEFFTLNLTLNLLYAFLRCWQIFRHSTAQFLDGLANLAPHIIVGLIGGSFSLNILPRSFSSVWVARKRFAANSVLPI